MKEKIEAAARELAEEIGAVNITKRLVCLRAHILPGLFDYIVQKNFDTFIKDLDLPIGRQEGGSRAVPSIRKKHVLMQAIEIAKEKGYTLLHREEVAARAGVSTPLVSHYFGTTKNLRQEVLREAIKLEVLEVIAQAIALRDPLVANLPKNLKKRAINSLFSEVSG